MQPIEGILVNEGDQVVLLARVCDNDQSPLTQATVSAVNVRSYNQADPANYIVSDDPSVSSVVYNTLQTWPTVPGFTAPDSTGYNVRYVTPATFFPQGAQDYQVEMKLTTSASVIRTQIWRVRTTNLFQR